MPEKISSPMPARIAPWRGRAPQLAVLATLLVGLVLFMRELSDPDIWFHLTIGREIFTTGALPATEFYIFPAASELAHYPAAGYGLLQYLLFVIGGIPALAVFNAAVFMTTLRLLHRAAVTGLMQRPDGLKVLMALSIVLWGLNPRFVFRPETILFAFIGLEVLLLEHWLRSGRIRPLYVLPLLSWTITLLHTTWVVLVLVLGAYGAHWLVECLRRRALPVRAHMWMLAHVVAVGALMCLVPLANPYGLAQLEILPASFAAAGNDLVEYLPIHRTEYFANYVVLAACTILGWIATRRARPCDVLMATGFGILAFVSARNIALFGLACFLPLVHALHRTAQPRNAIYRAIGAGLATMLTLGAIASERTWGYGIQRDTLPETGAALIRQHLPPCNVFNFFHFGGYLAWELDAPFKVAMDGHFVRPTAAASVHNEFFRAEPHWPQIAGRYDVCAIVTPATLAYSGTLIPLVQSLAMDPRWRLVAVEGAGLTFFRADLGPRVASLPKRLVWEQVVREAEKTLDRYPRQPGALEALRIARSHLGTG